MKFPVDVREVNLFGTGKEAKPVAKYDVSGSRVDGQAEDATGRPLVTVTLMLAIDDDEVSLINVKVPATNALTLARFARAKTVGLVCNPYVSGGKQSFSWTAESISVHSEQTATAPTAKKVE
jgi:hypothetical protein